MEILWVQLLSIENLKDLESEILKKSTCNALKMLFLEKILLKKQAIISDYIELLKELIETEEFRNVLSIVYTNTNSIEEYLELMKVIIQDLELCSKKVKEIYTFFIEKDSKDYENIIEFKFYEENIIDLILSSLYKEKEIEILKYCYYSKGIYMKVNKELKEMNSLICKFLWDMYLLYPDIQNEEEYQEMKENRKIGMIRLLKNEDCKVEKEDIILELTQMYIEKEDQDILLFFQEYSKQHPLEIGNSIIYQFVEERNKKEIEFLKNYVKEDYKEMIIQGICENLPDYKREEIEKLFF